MTPLNGITDWQLGFATGALVGIIAGLLLALAIAYLPELARQRSLKDRECAACGCTDSEPCITVNFTTSSLDECARAGGGVCTACQTTDLTKEDMVRAADHNAGPLAASITQIGDAISEASRRMI